MFLKKIIAGLLAAALAGCALAPSADRAAPPPSLEKVAEGVWIHKSYKEIPPYGPFLSQGMVVRSGDFVALVDTAWSDADTERLLELIEKAAGRRPDFAILTHAHEDKMGGVKKLRDAGVKTYAHPLTNADAPKRGLVSAEKGLDMGDYEEMAFVWGTPVKSKAPVGNLIVLYPGPGHTRDNIVVYDAPAKVLFGGCLIRPAESDNLGNIADADIFHWAEAVRAVAARFPEAEIVIPSHGAIGGRELFDHTIALAEKAARAVHD